MDDIVNLLVQLQQQLTNLENHINDRIDGLEQKVDAGFAELRREVHMAQQATIDTSLEVKREVLELNQRLNVHRQKFVTLEEEISILKARQ